MIDNERDLQKLVDQARQTDSIALDTEFVWERTYYPRLGLIQLALSDEQCYLIDPLACTDLTALGTVLSDRNVVKILHDAPQDLTILSRATGSIPVNVFDTRVAAGFCGLAATISLADLITGLLEIDLAKSETRTNWLKRPLAPDQIDYARDDVRYLRAVRVLLLSRIIVPEIRGWLKEELAGFDDPRSYAPVDDYERFLRVKGAGSLAGSGLAILRELAAWREQEARYVDRPRGHVVSDRALVAIAREQPQTVAALRDAGCLSAAKLKRYGTAIMTCIQTGRAHDPAGLPQPRRPVRLNSKERDTYARLSSFVSFKCGVQGIDPHLIGTTADLKYLAKNLSNPGSRLPGKLTNGWRRTFLEEFFRQRA